MMFLKIKNLFPAIGDFCHLLIIFAYSLEPDQAGQNVKHSDGIPERYFLKRLILKKIQQMAKKKKTMKNFPGGRVKNLKASQSCMTFPTNVDFPSADNLCKQFGSTELFLTFFFVVC